MSVYGRNLCLLTAEEIIGLQHIVDGRHEVGVAVSAGQITREGGQESQLSIRVTHDQHAEHLACSYLLCPLGVGLQMALQLLGCKAREGVWHIVERPGELRRGCDALDILLKTM